MASSVVNKKALMSKSAGPSDVFRNITRIIIDKVSDPDPVWTDQETVSKLGRIRIWYQKLDGSGSGLNIKD